MWLWCAVFQAHLFYEISIFVFFWRYCSIYGKTCRILSYENVRFYRSHLYRGSESLLYYSRTLYVVLNNYLWEVRDIV